MKLQDDEKEFEQTIPTRRSIHSEIEEILIKKLFSLVENIEELPSGELNFKPYTDYDLIQIEAFLEKKFQEKIFDQRKDRQIISLLQRIKNEREQRDFGDLVIK